MYVFLEDAGVFACSSFGVECESFASLRDATSFCETEGRRLATSAPTGVPAVSATLFSVFVGTAGTNELSRVLIALNAMIPDTATTCNSNTISSARDSFMFGSGMSPKSIPADAAEARRAVAARSFLYLKSCRIFIGLFGLGPARAHEIDHPDRRSF